MNKILQIEVGEYKDRESVMFSMVEEASLLKQQLPETQKNTQMGLKGRENKRD